MTRSRGWLPRRLDPRRRLAPSDGLPTLEGAVLIESAAVGILPAVGEPRWIIEVAGREHGTDNAVALPLVSSTENLAMLIGVLIEAAKKHPELFGVVERGGNGAADT